MAHPRKPPYRRKNVAKISYASQVIANFVPNFVAMATGVGRGKCNWQHSMAHFRKPPYRHKNLAKIFFASRVKANFVPNFVAMATGVGRGKMQLAAFDGPFPKTPLKAQKSPKNLLRKLSYSPFCPKFRCHGSQGGSGVKLNDAIRLAIPENHTLEPKIMTLSYTQPKLWPF